MTMYLSSPMQISKGASMIESARNGFHPLRWFKRRLLRRPTSTLAMSVGSLFAGIIAMNALALQTERHPAPMFSSLIEERTIALPTSAIPAPPVRPQTAERRVDSASRDASRSAAVQKDDAARVTANSGMNAKDQMLAIIRGGAPESQDQSQKISQTQRALNKSGYGPLKEDGVMGTGTRQALERFEADRKLPVRGELQGKTIRELSRASGVAIE